MKKRSKIIYLSIFIVLLCCNSLLADVLMIPAASFRPYSGSYYRNDGSTVYSSSYSSQYFYAPVILPQGTRVQKIVFYFLDDGVYEITLSLFRRNCYVNDRQTMAEISTFGSASNWRVNTTHTIYTPIINMNGYSYFLELYFESYGTAYQVQAVKIIYK